MKLTLASKRVASIVMWTGYLALFTLVLFWALWLAPSNQYPVPLATAIGLLPLVLPLRGAIKGRHRSVFWLSLASLIYLFHGIGVIASNPALRWVALLEACVALILCAGAWMFMRAMKLSKA